MDVAVVPVFSTHVVGVVGGGETAEVFDEFGVFGGEDGGAEGV